VAFSRGVMVGIEMEKQPLHVEPAISDETGSSGEAKPS